MPLTEEQRDKVTAWRKDKGIDRCLACGYDGEMQCGDLVLALIPDPRGSIRVNQATGAIGMVPVVCPNCSYIMLHEPVTMGFPNLQHMGGPQG